MNFHLQHPRIADTGRLLDELRARDPVARVTIKSSGSVEVTSQMPRSQAEAAFASAGVALLPSEPELHVSGGSTCCGSCA